MELVSHTQPRPDKRGYIQVCYEQVQQKERKGKGGQSKADGSERDDEEIIFDSNTKIK